MSRTSFLDTVMYTNMTYDHNNYHWLHDYTKTTLTVTKTAQYIYVHIMTVNTLLNYSSLAIMTMLQL